VHSNRRQQLAALLVVLVLATAAAWGQQNSVIAPPALVFPPLEAYLEALRLQVGIPGMSAAVVQDGEVVWERGFGFQNLAARVRATPDTPYRIGGISETFGAVLLLECVEQRRLILDQPIRLYGVTAAEPNVTLRQVLSHTSGDNSGDTFKYSPERYAELTSAVEWCVKQPYRKTVSTRILNRLAMKDSVPGSDLQDPEVVPEGLYDQADLDRYRHVLGKMAVPYKVDGRLRPERTELPPEGMNAASGLVSTVRDLAQFDAAVDSALLLNEDTLADAWTPRAVAGRPPLPMGLGWFVRQYRGERVVWHFGLVPNAYSSLIVKLPARRLTFILLANSDGLSAPFPLASGDLTRSLFATLFLKLAI
jgi:CubicO group peptidase (beta-lactamase class C family)